MNRNVYWHCTLFHIYVFIFYQVARLQRFLKWKQQYMRVNIIDIKNVNVTKNC